jgi:hypothetical protein
MTEPRRLLDESTGLDRAILESALDDSPSPARRRRVVAAVTAAGATAATTTAAAATGGVAVWKIVVGIAALTGLGVGASILHAQLANAPATVVVLPTSSVVVTPSAPPTISIASEIAPIADPPAVVPPKPVIKKPVPPAEATAPSIGREIALIDDARKSIAAGDGASALIALDQYAVECRGGALALEATVLRIEAVAATGDRDRAAVLAQKFLNDHPGTAYEARVRRHLPNP